MRKNERMVRRLNMRAARAGVERSTAGEFDSWRGRLVRSGNEGQEMMRRTHERRKEGEHLPELFTRVREEGRGSVGARFGLRRSTCLRAVVREELELAVEVLWVDESVSICLLSGQKANRREEGGKARK